MNREKNIQKLISLLICIVIIVFILVEMFFFAGYKVTLSTSAQALMNASIDQIYNDINELWHEINLISSTISRSDAVREYVQAQVHDIRMYSSMQAAVNLTNLASNAADSIIVTDFDDEVLFAYGGIDKLVMDHARAAMKNGLIVKSPIHMQIGQGDKSVLYCVNITDSSPTEKQFYTIVVYNINRIHQSILSINTDYGTNLLLLDRNDVPLAGNSVAIESETLAGILEHADNLYELSLNKQIQVRRLSLMHWRLIAFLSEDALIARMQLSYSFAWVMNICMLLVLICFLFVLNKHINQPVKKILHFMDHISDGKKYDRLDLGIKNEINLIAEGMNDMLTKIGTITKENLRQREQIYNVELSQKQAEIASLSNQINPHFLYNTLDCMRGMAMTGGLDGLEQIISSMAYIFRYSTKAGASVTVSDEIQSIEKYMTIVHIRHKGRIETAYEIDPIITGCYIPKMILQPIVENAVFHGLEAVNRKGHLTVCGRREQELLVFTIEDDGKGMSLSELHHIRQSLCDAEENQTVSDEHLGLINIHKRLHLLFGTRCGLSIESKENCGTLVMVKMLPQEISTMEIKE